MQSVEDHSQYDCAIVQKKEFGAVLDITYYVSLSSEKVETLPNP